MTTIPTFTLPDLTIAVQDGLAYPLTPCCLASGKGSSNVESGVVCRACYREVDAVFGSAAPMYDVPGAWPTERIVASWVPSAEDFEVAAAVAWMKSAAA